jgi:hypothetical protein
MLVRVVVLAGAVMDLAARVAALDLDRRVPDVEAFAQPALQVTNHMLGFTQRALLQDHVNRQRHRL